MKVAKFDKLESENYDDKVVFKTITRSNGILARIAIMAPNLDVLSKPHSHDGREALYVMKGSGIFSDGKTETKVEVGHSMVVDPNEEHNLISGDDGITLFEIKW